jgi:hypothetical protein
MSLPSLSPPTQSLLCQLNPVICAARVAAQWCVNLFVGNSKPDTDCAKERADCSDLCTKARYDPDLRNVWGGSFQKCMKGCLSKECGGN